MLQDVDVREVLEDSLCLTVHRLRDVAIEPSSAPSIWLTEAVLSCVSVSTRMMASALSYLTGIQAARSLGPRLSSFVGLGEVLFAAALAALLLGQLLGAAQAVGGALVVGGVVLVRLGERHVGGPKPAGPG